MMRILSLGAGVQSSTLALMAAHGEIVMPDYAIFADTQAEPASVYDWLDWLEKQLPFPVIRVTKGNLSAEALRIRTSAAGNNYQKSAPPAWIISEGNVGLLKRQCTADFKITPIVQQLRKLGGKKSGVEQLIGISLDEAQRIKPAKEPWITNRYPLIEKRMTRRACLEWMKQKGYPLPPRSSCVFCPFHNDYEWRRLQRYEPYSFEYAIDWEVDFQKTMRKVTGFYGIPYLHRSCIPLSEIDFTPFDVEPPFPPENMDLFGNECEGMCGV